MKAGDSVMKLLFFCRLRVFQFSHIYFSSLNHFYILQSLCCKLIVDFRSKSFIFLRLDSSLHIRIYIQFHWIFAKIPNDDPHSLTFNLPSSIGSTARIPILFPEDYEVWTLHFEDYVLGIDTHGSRICHAMTSETYK